MSNLIHVGLPKTATTTLQDHVFASQTRLNYLGKIGNAYADERARELVARVRLQDSLSYDPVRARSLVDDVRRRCEQVGDRRPLLLSEEGLSAEGRADRGLIAERLHDLFGPARVLIVLRSQPSLLQSLYLNDLKSSGRRPLPFDQWLTVHYGERWSGGVRVGLDYDRLVRAYDDVFGSDNVVVLAFESIRQDVTTFARAVSQLLGSAATDVEENLTQSHENVRLSERHRAALRLQNLLPEGSNLALTGRRLLPRSVYIRARNFVVGGRRVDTPELPEDWTNRIAALCAEGNAALARRKRLPLGELGYPMAAAPNAEAAA
jgi:hypothetical protein